MKTSTKIGIGFSIATIAGVYAAVTFSEKIIEKFEHEATRYKTKKIVNEKFGGNDKLLDVVEDLSDSGLSIDGIKTITECELPTELHQEIVQRAVELAKAAYIGDLSSTVGIGNLSSTNIGIIPSNTSK